MAQVINCPYCGKLTDPKLEACPHCGGPMQQKRPGPPPPGRGVGGAAAPAAVRQTCPNCHALVQDGDIICVACGTNLLTGQKIAAESRPVPTGDRRWLLVAAIAVVAVLVLLAAAFAVYYFLSQDPVEKATELSAAGKELEAANVLSGYLAKHPGNLQAHLLLGKIEWKRGQFGEAADSFETVGNGPPPNREASLLAVLSLASVNDPAARGRQVEILKRLAQQNPNDAEAQYLLALELAAENDAAGAIEALQQVLRADPTDGKAQEQLGIALALQGDYDGALQQLTGAVQKPGQMDATAALGFAAHMAGKPDLAVENLKLAAEASGAVKNQVLTRLGVLLVSLGQFEEADTYLGEAVSGNKDNVTAEFFHAVCLQSKGLLPEAATAFGALAQKGGPMATEALERAADVLLMQGNLQQARQTLEKAEGAGNSSAALCTLRGRLHAATGEERVAREWFQKAEKADPNYAAAHLENGLLFVRQQVFKEGIQELERYLALVGADREGTRAAEIESLLEHLRQAAEKGAPSADGAAVGSERSVL